MQVGCTLRQSIPTQREVSGQSFFIWRGLSFDFTNSCALLLTVYNTVSKPREASKINEVSTGNVASPYHGPKGIPMQGDTYVRITLISVGTK